LFELGKLAVWFFCSMLTCLVTLWVRNQHPSPFFLFGFVLLFHWCLFMHLRTFSFFMLLIWS